MKNRISKDYQNFIKESGVNLDDFPLTSKKINKSTRTTFNLNKKLHEAMNLLCMNYGMKQKTFIDDVVVPNASYFVSTPELKKIISQEKDGNKSQDLERKTFVLGKSSLKKLNDLSKDTGIHRDRLFSAAVAMEMVKQEKRNDKYHKAIEMIEKIVQNINDVEGKLKAFLGDDDPIPNRVRIVGVILDNLLMAIDAELNRGVPIDYDDFLQQG